MSGLRSVTVDVRDMLCAQALAVVAQAAGRLPAGEALEIMYNAEDVKQDLIAWAQQRGRAIQDAGPMRLRLVV
jgi:TusA-related sulfurtransferase